MRRVRLSPHACTAVGLAVSLVKPDALQGLSLQLTPTTPALLRASNIHTGRGRPVQCCRPKSERPGATPFAPVTSSVETPQRFLPMVSYTPIATFELLQSQ